MQRRSLKATARWYVYALTDPRDGAVFYVGKGTGNRIHQHEKDAANERTVCSKKINRIRDLQTLELTCRISEAFYNEIMPSLWRRIVDDAMALAVVRRGLLPYGVEIA